MAARPTVGGDCRHWRLRECNYGLLNGSSAAEMHAHRADYINKSYPDGESWRQAVDHMLLGTPLEELALRQLDWQPGWEYMAAETD